jgi:hypothetical protein
MDGTAKCIFGRLHAQQRTDGKQDFSPVSFISLDPSNVLHLHNPIIIQQRKETPSSMIFIF